jgi:hypothetical protein
MLPWLALGTNHCTRDQRQHKSLLEALVDNADDRVFARLWLVHDTWKQHQPRSLRYADREWETAIAFEFEKAIAAPTDNSESHSSCSLKVAYTAHKSE